MPEAPVISVRNVTKSYRIWTNPATRLVTPLCEFCSRLLPPRLGRSVRSFGQNGYHDFDALKEVSLEVQRGEAVGIIGRNGSGKSTLLQIIAGTLTRTSGAAAVQGRVAALLELGSGFNPQFTGRENVYLNGALLGLSRVEIDTRFDAIAAYADIGEFIDQPVQIYSSGMVVRLAFAVCVHVEADILIIDEALGVGDARFQLKCARTLDRFIANGRTLLFVSHDLNSVKRLCSRAVLLDGGHLLYSGLPNVVVNLYSKLTASPQGKDAIVDDILALQSAPPAESPRPQPPLEVAPPQGHAAKLIASERDGLRPAAGEYAYGGEHGTIVQCTMTGADGTAKTLFSSGEAVEVRLAVRAKESVPEPIYAMTLKTLQGQEVYGTNTLFSRQPAPGISAGAEATVWFRFPLNLIGGEYFLSVGWTYFAGSELVVVHRRYDVIKFTVLGVDGAFGIAHLFAAIDVLPHRDAPPA